MLQLGIMLLYMLVEFGDNALIGMGSIILDNAVINKMKLILAGAVVTPGSEVKKNELWAGNQQIF